MSEPSVIHDTFVLERSFPKPPARVFQAFLDPAQKRRWFAEGLMHDIVRFDMDFRVGGAETLVYKFKETTPFAGVVLTNGTIFQDIEENRRIVIAQTMDFAGKRISASLVTFELLPSKDGTDLICTHQAAYFEGADGPQIRKQGWVDLMAKLAQVLE